MKKPSPSWDGRRQNAEWQLFAAGGGWQDEASVAHDREVRLPTAPWDTLSPLEQEWLGMVNRVFSFVLTDFVRLLFRRSWPFLDFLTV